MGKSHEDMKKQGNFWFGLVLGGLASGSALYMFGTKKGRKKLSQLLDTFENIEDLIPDLPSVEGKKQDNPFAGLTGDIQSLLGKIQDTLPTKKEVSKYFVKDGKLLK